MKKISLLVIFILISGLFVGCGSSGGGGGNGNDSKFSPPSWIQGEWADEYDTNNYKFTNDNVILTSDTISINFKETFKDVSVDETKTDSLYRINVSDSEYKFEKLSDTTLNYSITSSGVTVGPIKLITK